MTIMRKYTVNKSVEVYCPVLFIYLQPTKLRHGIVLHLLRLVSQAVHLLFNIFFNSTANSTCTAVSAGGLSLETSVYEPRDVV